MPELAKNGQFERVNARVFLSGFTPRQLIPAEVVQLTVEMDGKKFPIKAAVYEGLEAAVRAPFLIDEMLFRAAENAGIKFV